MSHGLIRAVGVFAAAGLALGLSQSAHATFFSFASDINSNGFTFAGTSGSGGSFTFGEANRPNTFNLLIDDNNGPNPSVSLGVEFRANLVASHHVGFTVGPLIHHSYQVSGSFGFYQNNVALLTVQIGSGAPGVLTVPGSSTTWSSTGAVLGADSYADVTYTATNALVAAMAAQGANASNYGITVGPSGTASSTGPDDFSFSLTFLNSGGIGNPVPLNANTGLPTASWQSEASYSGSATAGIPAPSAALVGVGAAVIGLRRRRPR